MQTIWDTQLSNPISATTDYKAKHSDIPTQWCTAFESFGTLTFHTPLDTTTFQTNQRTNRSNPFGSLTLQTFRGIQLSNPISAATYYEAQRTYITTPLHKHFKYVGHEHFKTN